VRVETPIAARVPAGRSTKLASGRRPVAEGDFVHPDLSKAREPAGEEERSTRASDRPLHVGRLESGDEQVSGAMNSGKVFDSDGIFPADERWYPGEFSDATFLGIHIMRNFEGATFNGAHFVECTLRDNTFLHCDLRNIKLTNCVLANVSFTDLDLQFSEWKGTVIENSDFVGCFFSGASFAQAALKGVTFDVCEYGEMSLASAQLENVRFGDWSKMQTVNLERTVFYDCDMQVFCEMPPRAVRGVPVLDWRSVCRSIRIPDLKPFLVQCGMPEVMAMYLVESAKAIDPLLLFHLMQSTFISYGSPDVALARKLRERLNRNGVRTFFFELDAIPGERLRKVMRGKINECDRVVLLCSASSLTRPAVRNEIEETLAREARDGGASYLIPVTLDDFLFEWKDELAAPLLDRVVADFRGTRRSSKRFDQAVLRLLTALKLPDRQ